MNGDIVWAAVSDGQGHEQVNEPGRRRPYVVVSDPLVFERSGLIVACPVTSNLSPGPKGMEWFRFKLDPQTMVDADKSAPTALEPGVVLCEQVRVLDVVRRLAMSGGSVQKAGRLNPDARARLELPLCRVLRLPTR